MAESRLDQLSARGQSVWIDYLSRDLLETGELKRMMEEDAVVGVTSNPTIFQKAISQGDAYDEQLRSCSSARTTRRRSSSTSRVRDVENALDLLLPGARAERAGRLRLDRGRPDPRLRHEGDVRRGDPAARVDPPAEPLREDPRHRAGPAGDRGLHRRRPQHQRHAPLLAADAQEGRWRRTSAGSSGFVEGGGDPSKVRSVASFFVSRVDTETDKRLEAIGSEEALALRGKLADREREARVPALPAGRSAARAGRRSRRRARCRSAACGLPRRRRTRRTATSSTSRS